MFGLFQLLPELQQFQLLTHQLQQRPVRQFYLLSEEFQDRLFFATDLLSPGQDLPQIEYLNSAVQQGKITRGAFEKITWKNADRLLGLGIG